MQQRHQRSSGALKHLAFVTATQSCVKHKCDCVYILDECRKLSGECTSSVAEMIYHVTCNFETAFIRSAALNI